MFRTKIVSLECDWHLVNMKTMWSEPSRMNMLINFGWKMERVKSIVNLTARLGKIIGLIFHWWIRSPSTIFEWKHLFACPAIRISLLSQCWSWSTSLVVLSDRIISKKHYFYWKRNKLNRSYSCKLKRSIRSLRNCFKNFPSSCFEVSSFVF